MPFLIAGVVLVGAIAVLNLLLTMAVIRRLRRNEAAMSMPEMDSGPKAGSTLPAFTGSTSSGEEVTTESLTGQPAVFAFFSTTCSACKPALPKLIEHAEAQGLKPSQVIAVIGGEGDESAEFEEALEGKATVLHEAAAGPIGAAFDIAAFPTFVHVGADGLVTNSHSGAGELAGAH